MSLFDKKSTEVDNSWMDTFGDMVSLLLCFFIMLASISKIDATIFEQVQSGMAKDIGGKSTERPIETMKQEVSQAVQTMSTEDAIDVGTDERGLVLNLVSGAMFKPSSADIRDEMKPVLKEIVDTLSQPRFTAYNIEIQGHTDDTPIKNAQFPSNWDLSAARALATQRLFMEFGLSSSRMSIGAFADNRPRAPNHSPDGTTYPENQAMNRRVQIHVYPR